MAQASDSTVEGLARAWGGLKHRPDRTALSLVYEVQGISDI